MMESGKRRRSRNGIRRMAPREIPFKSRESDFLLTAAAIKPPACYSGCNCHNFISLSQSVQSSVSHALKCIFGYCIMQSVELFSFYQGKQE